MIENSTLVKVFQFEFYKLTGFCSAYSFIYVFIPNENALRNWLEQTGWNFLFGLDKFDY